MKSDETGDSHSTQSSQFSRTNSVNHSTWFWRWKEKAAAATSYVFVKQESGTSQALLTAKARLAKKDKTIPRLELVAAHMTINMLSNARKALAGYPVVKSYCWSDSSTALYWIKGDGSYKQNVKNRISNIRSQENVIWRQVPREENPADLGSRGETISKLDGFG